MILRSLAVLVALALPVQAETAIQAVTSPGGIKAWLVEDHTIPFVALELRFQGGNSLDLAGKRGAVNLMTATLEEGAGAMDSQGFAAARDSLAAQIGFSSDGDGISVSSQFLTENRDQGVTLLREALVNPRFDQDAVDRVKGQVLANLRAGAEDPGTIAGDLMAARTYGSHPYGSNGDGTIDSVTALTRDDVVTAWKGAIARDRVFVSAAGDISPEDLGKLLDRLLGDLPATGAPLPGKAEITLKGGLMLKTYPGPQSVVQFTQGGIRFDDPDYFAAVLLNEILGGGRFSARLMTEVREKRGLTYGVSSDFSPGLDRGAFVIGLQTRPDQAAEALKVSQDVLRKFIAEGPTEKELKAAKDNLIGGFALRIDSNRKLLGNVSNIAWNGLPLDYLEHWTDRVQALSTKDVKEAMQRMVQPERMVTITLGAKP